jgi:hypothetical protein
MSAQAKSHEGYEGMIMMNKKYWLGAVCALTLPVCAMAVEGMWTPEQLGDVVDDMKALGFALDAEQFRDLTAFPMGAVVSLGGCSASFVSPQGLVVTNHHCAAGSIQYNSREGQNLLVDGFLAADLKAELPAAPGSRVYVTVAFDDVTAEVKAAIPAGAAGKARFDAIEAKQKAMIAECEADAGHRCTIASFHGGAEYKRIKQLEIRDVRLTYAPAESIGTFGGDIDNWMWPRHTGDFAFYRAYVGKDGKPADFAEDNIPFTPKHVLKVSAAGLDDGDFVMVAGYPGSTSRYRRAAEVGFAFEFTYPQRMALFDAWIKDIEAASPADSDARIKYESLLQGLNNAMKNYGGQIEGARRVKLLDRRKAREAALDDWLMKDASRRDLAREIAELDRLIAVSNDADRRDYYYSYATRAGLLNAAQTLYRYAHERARPDADRDPAFQDRNASRIRQGQERIERRYDDRVDLSNWSMFLENYLAGPATSRVAALDEALGLKDGMTRAEIKALIAPLYAGTRLGDKETRLALLEASVAELDSSTDPFIMLARKLSAYERAQEEAGKERAGQFAQLRPAYMEAIIAYAKSRGEAVYPDANSTLRLTYGTVMGGSPKDGLIYTPFTTLQGILDKDTGEFPFNSPQSLLDKAAAKEFGDYALESIGSVPVNFLTDLDSTGGNSGSPTLNAQGELVGLLFDGTIESVNSDWDFDPRTTRSIHVDSRYMLWVMEKIDGAQHLIDEMTVVR